MIRDGAGGEHGQRRAQIFQAGIEDTAYGAQPYFAMELVVGKRLDEYIRDLERQLSLAKHQMREVQRELAARSVAA